MTDTNKNAVLRAYLESEMAKCQARQEILRGMMAEINCLNLAPTPMPPQNLVDSIIPRSEQITTAVLRPSQPEGPAQITHSILSGGPVPRSSMSTSTWTHRSTERKRSSSTATPGSQRRLLRSRRSTGGPSTSSSSPGKCSTPASTRAFRSWWPTSESLPH